jgi:uncharacterized protein (DUF1697 family)
VRTHIALLRGVNVGGNNLIKMADLTALLPQIGLEEGKTLLQSGNVVFRSEGKSSRELEELLERKVESRLGLRTQFMVRSVKEWDEVIAANPFVDEAETDPSHLLVVFMKQPCEEGSLEAVRAAYSGPEKFALVKGCLYVVFPIGIGDSKLSAFTPWKKLAGAGTARNWNTVLKLAASCRE